MNNTLSPYDTFKRLHTALTPLFASAINARVFPGAVIAITAGHENTNQSMVRAFGSHTYNGSAVSPETFYDLASLTKTVTTLAIFSLINNAQINLRQKLGKLLKQQVPADKKDITLAQLLNHCSGLAAHRPYFEELCTMPLAERQDFLMAKILADPLASDPGQKQVYSDLGFILLGKIIETQSGQSLDQYIVEKIFQPLDLNRGLFFNREKTRSGIYAPTEQCLWRHKLICGQVHDDNSYAVDGVSGQAGLFGNIWGMMDLVNFIKDFASERQQHPNLSSTDIRQAVQPQNPQQGTWGLGFDTPSAHNSSSGQYFSAHSFGHLGFTGTSFWVDLERNISVVLLSNRVHPERHNFKIKQFRPAFHDVVMKILTQQASPPGNAS